MDYSPNELAVIKDIVDLYRDIPEATLDSIRFAAGPPYTMIALKTLEEKGIIHLSRRFSTIGGVSVPTMEFGLTRSGIDAAIKLYQEGKIGGPRAGELEKQAQ